MPAPKSAGIVILGNAQKASRNNLSSRIYG